MMEGCGEHNGGRVRRWSGVEMILEGCRDHDGGVWRSKIR